MDSKTAKTVEVGAKVVYAHDGVPAWASVNWCIVAGLKIGRVYTVRKNHLSVFRLNLAGIVDIGKAGYCFPVEHFELYVNPIVRVVNCIKRLFIK